MACVLDIRAKRHLPKSLAQLTENLETEHFHYDHARNALDCKLLKSNPYRLYFKQVYPSLINEHDLTQDMLNVIHSYTDSLTNECYMKTNLNLLSANLEEIDWTYVNKLRSFIRGLKQSNLRHAYYRGLTLSEKEIEYYMREQKECYYTNSFLSFTIDRLLVYPGNAIIILNTASSNDVVNRNLANIWKWSARTDEKEALLAVGTKLKILSVHYYGCKWEIEVELTEDDEETEKN